MLSHPDAKILKSGGNNSAFVPLNVTLYLKPRTKLSLTMKKKCHHRLFQLLTCTLFIDDDDDVRSIRK